MSVVSFFLMGGVIALVVFIQLYYYDFIDLEPKETFGGLLAEKIELEPGSEKKGYRAFVSLMIVFAGLEMVVALISSFLGCCQYTIEPDNDGVVLQRNNSMRNSMRSIKAAPAVQHVESMSPFTTAIGQPLPQQALSPIPSGGQGDKYVYIEQPYLYDPNTNTARPLGNQGGSMRGMNSMMMNGGPMGGMNPMMMNGSMDGMYPGRPMSIY
jgi:hypothetical protein